MKRFGTRHVYMLVVFGLHFLCWKIAFSQQQQLTSFSSKQALKQFILQAIIDAKDSRPDPDPDVPVPQMWNEPKVTAGNFNHVYWDFFPDTVYVDSDRIVPVYVQVEAALDTSFSFSEIIKDTTIDVDANFATIKNLPINGNGVYYRATLWSLKIRSIGVREIAISDYSDTLNSTQDTEPPTLNGDLIVIPGENDNGKNGWLTVNKFSIKYGQIDDSLAGISKVFLHGDLDTVGTIFAGNQQGDTGPKVIQGGTFTLRKSDGVHNFQLGSIDAAYSPVQVDRIFDILGNEDGTLALDSVKIDTKKPIFDPVQITLPITPKNREIIIPITDVLSGVDTSATIISFDPALPGEYTVRKEFVGQTCNATIRITSLSVNMTSMLKVETIDIAGNPADTTMSIQFRFDPPELRSFRMVDLDFENADTCLTPAAKYTDSTWVRLDSFELAPGDSAKDMRITVQAGRERSGNVIKPFPLGADGSLVFNLLEPLSGAPLPNGAKVNVQIAAIDKHENEQIENVPNNSIYYFDQPPVFDFVVQDPNPIAQNPRNGAEPGWTNDSKVLVKMTSPDSAFLYKISRLEPALPEPTCRNADSLTFYYEFPDPAQDGLWTFQYQVRDSAGNASVGTPFDITLDTFIEDITADDFVVLDRTSLIEECTNDSLVYVVFLRQIEDLSRIVVNDIPYQNPSNDTLTVPNDSNGSFTLSIVDFAGNESVRDGKNLSDTLAPVIDLSPVKDIYSSKDVKEGTLPIVFKLSDQCSGVDTSSIIAVIPGLNKVAHRLIYNEMSQAWTDTVWFDNLPETTQNITLSVTALDEKGNDTTRTKAFKYIPESGKVTAFFIEDLNLRDNICLLPDSSYTNSTVIYLDRFEFKNGIAPDSLMISGDDDTVAIPYSTPPIEFDLALVQNDFISGQLGSITINGFDALNEQNDGPTQTFIFDDVTPIFDSLVVRDLNPVDNDVNRRNGAYPGWTNNQKVWVTIYTDASDLYNIKRLNPTEPDSCRNADSLAFYYTFPSQDNREWAFDYQIGDSAGNLGTTPPFIMNLDTTVPVVTEADFIILDRSSLREECTNDTLVYVIYQPEIPQENISRIVVNDHVFFAEANDTLTVPNDRNGAFQLSVVDSAGNEALAANKDLSDKSPPFIDLSQVDSVYSSPDFDPNIEITIEFRDLCAGVDTSSIIVEMDALELVGRTITSNDPQNRNVELTASFGPRPEKDDTTNMLSVYVRDMEGRDTTKTKRVEIRVEAPRVVDYRIRDINLNDAICLVPHESFTNSAMVQLDSFQFEPGDEKADSLVIIGKDRKVVLKYQEPLPPFDLRDVIYNINRVDTLELVIKGKDNIRLGNVQADSVLRTVYYDSLIQADIAVFVSDPTSADNDSVYRAFPGYTNDDAVHVVINSSDPADLYLIQQLSPKSDCGDTSLMDYYFTFEELSNGDKIFEYLAGDYAGNISNMALDTIKLDTSITPISESDFELSYDEERRDRERESDSLFIKIKYLFPDDANRDLSRFFVNGKLDTADINGAVTVSALSPMFTIAIIDSAGNKSNTITKQFDVIPPELLSLTLSDLKEEPFHAAPSFTNSVQVNLEITATDSGGSGLFSLYIDGDVEEVFVEEDGWLAAPVEVPNVNDSSHFLIKLTEAPNGVLTPKQVRCRVFDGEHNYSRYDSTSINYIKQEVSANIITQSGTDTEIVSETELIESSIWQMKVCYNMGNPDLAWRILTGNSVNPEDTVITFIDELTCISSGSDICCDSVKFKVRDKSVSYAYVFDKAGNKNDSVFVNIDIQVPPEIRLTLYDPVEFPSFNSPLDSLPEGDVARSDSLYTSDASNFVVAYAKKIKGDWQKIKFASLDSGKLDRSSWLPVADSTKIIDLRTLDLPDEFKNAGDTTDYMRYYVRVMNAAGDSTTASAQIIFDNEPPILTMGTKDYEPIVAIENGYTYTFGFDSSDTGPGRVAGMVVKEHIVDPDQGLDSTSYTYIDLKRQEPSIELMEHIGLRKITVFLVDNAGVDQNRSESDDDFVQTELRDRNLTQFRHPSKSVEFNVRLDHRVFSNYPNPFDPKDGPTFFTLPIAIEDGSKTTVSISIFDPFGNLVSEKHVECDKSFNDGMANTELSWDGKNDIDKGKFVANGGYICVINVHDTGEQFIRKIAVIKK
ncbi:hypothetical protein EH223_01290 [candidate division KSB1 bacterium]|nr:hypothetical protein [candidate division KSB1 bacterium]RQW06836.1 MAG: hypothetical protein EH223_01290 [candidate division KSB1 bacterium]